MLFKSSTLQQTIPFGSDRLRPSPLRQSPRPRTRLILRLGALYACAALLFGPLIEGANAQSPDISSLEAYVEAIKQPGIADQIGPMEHFLQVSGQSTLRLDALEILVIDYQKMNNPERAVARAHDLLNIDPSNPLAVAVLNENTSPATNRKARNDEFSAARRGLGNVDLLHKPEGMSQPQFAPLQQKIRGMLAGSIGIGYLDQQDYEKASTYLQQALAADPESARYNYGLAQALLSGSNGGTADAYWLMAKAVNMAKGTPNEQQISRDALRKYRENGGSEAVWNQLLAAAAASTSKPAQGNGGQQAQSATSPGDAAVTSNNSTNSNGAPVRNAQPAGNSASGAVNGSGATVASNNGQSANPGQAATHTATPSTTSSTPVATPPSSANSQAQSTIASPSQSAPPTSVTQTPASSQPALNQPASSQPAVNPPASNQPTGNQPPGNPQGNNSPPASSAVQPQTSVPPQTTTNAKPSPVIATQRASTATIPPAAGTTSGANAASANPPAISNPRIATNQTGGVTVGQNTPVQRTATQSTARNNPAQNTPTIAKASPPALPDRSSDLPESDQPILVTRPPITSSTPVGPTTAPLPDRKPVVAPPPVVTSPIITAPTGPVSLGILIQTELLSGNNREPILEAMREMARNLRPGDEAFVMAFSDELDFEQDLTENDELLEEGLENLRPKPGAALFEGMSFAVQHLKRIGKNGNRVLLIISDGRNIPSRNGPQHIDADVSRVRIDCIGLDVEHALDRQNLQKLAYWSGGMTSFVSDPEQIRTATSAIARTIVGDGFANR